MTSWVLMLDLPASWAYSFSILLRVHLNVIVYRCVYLVLCCTHTHTRARYIWSHWLAHADRGTHRDARSRTHAHQDCLKRARTVSDRQQTRIHPHTHTHTHRHSHSRTYSRNGRRNGSHTHRHRHRHRHRDTLSHRHGHGHGHERRDTATPHLALLASLCAGKGN